MFKAGLLVYWELAMWLLVSVAHADRCPLSCICTAVLRKGLEIDCSSQRLKEVPDLPHNTIKLYLQNNSLTTVPAGRVDHLLHLQEVDVSNNPWNCDCQILYLKLWLEDQHMVHNLANVRCLTPVSAGLRPLRQLTGNELAGCRRPWPINCHEFFGRDLILIGLALLLLALMSCAVWVAKSLACCVAMSEEFPGARLLHKYGTESFKSQ
ncbi:platelet glycoprotein IX [Lissotriton helveticus]